MPTEAYCFYLHLSESTFCKLLEVCLQILQIFALKVQHREDAWNN